MATGLLQSAIASRSSGGGGDDSICSRSSDKCDLNITSVDQTQKLLRLLGSLAVPDPRREEGEWASLFSLESLRLSLPQIIQDCRPANKGSLFEEFPFCNHLSVFGTFVKHPPPSPSRPKLHVNLTTLSLKKRYLKLLVRFYKSRIQWLSEDSRRSFGVVKGKRVVVLVEDSAQLGVLDAGRGVERLRDTLRLLVEEQLQGKECVYLIKFGSRASPSRPHPLPFLVKRTQCKAFADQWVGLLEGEGGCNLLDALRAALRLSPMDTVCVVLQTQPDQDLGLVRDYLVDNLTGEAAPRLHFVSHHSCQELRTELAELASATNGHFHSVCLEAGNNEEMTYMVEDSDIESIRQQISLTQSTLADVGRLKYGPLDDPTLTVLRELSLTTEWAEDDTFTTLPRPSEDHTHTMDTRQWLQTHSVESVGLGLYKFLAPNAYPQLSEHVQIIDRMAVSHVYDVMPIFTWDDGSIVYLHIDVHGFHEYLHTLTAHLTRTLTPRLQWLLSGSSVPFGVLTEPRVVLVLDSSHCVLAEVLTLQAHLRLLLEEQLSRVKEFNMISFGTDCSVLSQQFCEPSRETLLQAWEWILAMSPSGSCDLLSALRAVFEGGALLNTEQDADDPVGVYLVVTSMPDQHLESACGYIEQMIAGRAITLHTVYYNMEFSAGGLVMPEREGAEFSAGGMVVPGKEGVEFSAGGLVMPGREGGRYGNEAETEDFLRAVAKSGRGRFHQFRISGDCDGDDSELLLEEIRLAHSHHTTAETILNDYRDFCRRNVPPPPPLVSAGGPEHRHPPPPTQPRQTAASLARLNTGIKKAASHQPPPRVKGKGGRPLLKSQLLYTGHRNQKVMSLDLQSTKSDCIKKRKPLIPTKEAFISSKDWLLRYSVEKLDLSFSRLLPTTKRSRHSSRPGTPSESVTHKHINQQGKMVELMVDHTGLKTYVTSLQSVLQRYHSRLSWLQKDSHKCFGVVTEKDAVFLLDVSISMATHLDSIKDGLSRCLRELPPKLKRFNIIAYSSQVIAWRETLVPVSMETITEALDWTNTLKAQGGSFLLEAIKVALGFGAAAGGVYLLTDGASNHTQEYLLSQLPMLQRMYGDTCRVNTVALSSADSEDRCFLTQLAHRTGGRFHVAMATETSPLTGDDIHILNKEIIRAQEYLARAKILL